MNIKQHSIQLFYPILLTSFAFVFSSNLLAQELTPATEAGEDFDLYAAIGLFEEAEDLEDYEKKLNEDSNDVNNLDLNDDDEVDVVKLVEYSEDNTHLIVIQAVISETEVQDIATIEIEKHAEDQISLQFIGDEEIYGKDYIIEPAPEEGSISKSRILAVFVSVHLWRPVRVIYTPGRVVFVSRVVWRPRPGWYRMRRPVARSSWRARANRWHSPRYRSAKSRHSVRGRNMYNTKRKTSPTAKKHYGSKPGHSTGPSNQNKKPVTTQQKGHSPSQQKSKSTQPQQQKKKSQPKRR